MGWQWDKNGVQDNVVPVVYSTSPHCLLDRTSVWTFHPRDSTPLPNKVTSRHADISTCSRMDRYAAAAANAANSQHLLRYYLCLVTQTSSNGVHCVHSHQIWCGYVLGLCKPCSDCGMRHKVIPITKPSWSNAIKFPSIHHCACTTFPYHCTCPWIEWLEWDHPPPASPCSHPPAIYTYQTQSISFLEQGLIADLVNVGASTKTRNSGLGNVVYLDVSVQQASEVEGFWFCKMRSKKKTN